MKLSVENYSQKSNILDSNHAWQFPINDGQLIINEGFTEIGARAFEASTSLVCVKLPDGIQTIGERAFSCCPNLKEINFPPSLEVISAYAFSSCSFDDIRLPPRVIKLGVCAFGSCKFLVSVQLNDGLETIEKQAFGDCTKLSSLEIPKSISEIAIDAFDGCRGDFRLLVTKGSYAESYANAQGIQYVCIR